MKKIFTLLVFISSLFALAACQSEFSNTKVRVVRLSYSTLAEEIASIPSNKSMRLLSNKLLVDEVEEYIFPGDILTFTVELEDPNFEFISLLSIKFNDQVIRANVDNSIITTRDCGVNICVDFPFEISADRSDYSVQEVKFAKLNSDNGVNAIIDNQSVKTAVIEIYTDEIYPYVLESVQTLNKAISTMKYYENLSTIDREELMRNRRFIIANIPLSFTLMYMLLGETFSVDVLNGGNWDDVNTYFTYYTTDMEEQQTGHQLIYISILLNDSYPDGFQSSLAIFYFEPKYQDIFFYNVGNSIYVNILGREHFVIELVYDMKIVSELEYWASYNY